MNLLMLAAITASLAAAGEPPAEDDWLSEMFNGVSPERAAEVAASVAHHPLGSPENPVRADMPSGEQAYLSRLRCADGRRPRFEREGSFGDGPYGMIMDGYRVECPGSQPASSTIFMDMYHPGHVEAQAPSGFTIVP
jgi:hypothetical protein